ncbi:hypothetical protein ES708_29942 [subsurface metagenome]
MTKPRNPLLSLGARGTIADSLTFQKRGRGTIARGKPTPTDPKTLLQLAQRQRYREAVAAWNALTPEGKEAWRGVCPGLTAYQCFMRSELKWPPPPIPIDIGSDPTDRISARAPNFTYIDKANPANATGTLHTIKVYFDTDTTSFRVGTFYLTNANTLKCRDSVLIGAVASHAERTFTGLSISVVEGDYIGCFFTDGYIETDTEGFIGIWYKAGEFIDPGDEATYSFLGGDAISLYGIGTSN